MSATPEEIALAAKRFETWDAKKEGNYGPAFDPKYPALLPDAMLLARAHVEHLKRLTTAPK